ncbi:MAG: helix-turn-helix domain-containing protein [Nitrospinae bacterium]|nr:helix-turn-helix domain-containing protein [Nitrospinota bacterium]
MEKLMTINEVAEILSMKKSQLYQLTHQRRIPFLKKSVGLDSE